MKTFKFLILVLIIASLSNCAWLKGGDRTPSPVKLYNDKQQKTAGGNVVSSKSGVSTPFLAATDRAIYEVTEDAKAIYGNAEFLQDYGKWVVYVVPDCELSPEMRTRSFRVNGILAAEWVPNPSLKAYVVCESNVIDEDLKNALRYGPEHVILRWVDWDTFERTMKPEDHIHPLIPTRPN